MRRLRRVGTLAISVVVATTVLTGCGRSGTPARQDQATDRGEYEVGRLTQTFVDTRRATPPNGDAPGQPTRTLETLLMYPATGTGQSPPVAPGGPFPLLVFAHGFTATPAAYEKLLRVWAAAGYVVAAPAFPLSNGNAPGGPTQNDLPNQPGDVTFLITEVLALSKGDGPLRGSVDPARIGLAGHSMGATTTLGVVLNTCCHDDRIAAAVVLAGNEVPIPSGRYAVRDPTPVLFVHGDADTVVSYSAGRQAFTDAVAPKFFVTVLGGDHGRPYTAGTDPASTVVLRTTLDFLGHYLKGHADGLARLRADGAVAGVASVEAIEK